LIADTFYNRKILDTISDIEKLRKFLSLLKEYRIAQSKKGPYAPSEE